MRLGEDVRHILESSFLLVLLALGLALAPGPVRAAEPRVGAESAVLLEAETGEILWERRGEERRDIASTTKIMTALLALELGRLEEQVAVSENAAFTEGSSMELRPGEVYPLGELLEGLMLVSGNDAAVAVAEHLAGSVENFAILMNARARSLGLFNTRFANPHGLTEEGHFSTARDLALLTRRAMAVPSFRRLAGRREATACGWNPRGERTSRQLASTNRLLFSHPWIEGVKTGTTAAAGSCLVASGVKGGRRLIAVVLASPDRWGDTLELLEYGYNHFLRLNLAPAGIPQALVRVAGGRKREVPVGTLADLWAVVKKDELEKLRKVLLLPRAVSAPVGEGERVGAVVVRVGGKEVARRELVALQGVSRCFFCGR